MNKQKQIRSLTWRYFYQQKWEEIKEHFEEYYSCYRGIMIFSGFWLQLFWMAPFKGGFIIAIIGLCMIGFWGFIGFVALVKRIRNWIKSNWSEAKSRAEKEVKRK